MTITLNADFDGSFSMYRTIIERSLHSAMLPYLAFAAAYREHSVAAAARAHLDGLIALDPAAQKLVPLITHALTHERGTILEPFCCPEPLRAPLAAAMALLARGRFPKDAAHRSTLLVNQCTGSAWTGVECDAAGARGFRVRDFCTRVKAVQPPVRAGGRPYEPAIPLAFDLDRAARESPRAALAHIALDDVNPSLSIVFEAEGMLYGGENCRARDGARASCELAFEDPGIPLLDFATSGKHDSTGKGIELEKAVFRLNPTLMLRLASIDGPKRFVARRVTRVDSLVHQQIVVGEFDANRVRAVHAPSIAWSAPSHDRIPAVPLHEDPNAPGSLRSLINLLLASDYQVPATHPTHAELQHDEIWTAPMVAAMTRG